MSEKRLFLLDAYALIFRAYYALIKMPRTTQAGFNTSAIFGFVNTLEEVLRKEKPTHIAVCFDPAGPTFRSETDSSYKAQRDATPEDIKLSVPIIKEIVKAYNIPLLEAEGFEADDVIGTMAKKAEKEGFTTYMMTPDKDFGQLVSPDVLQYKPSYRGQDFEIRGVREVCERYGINRPQQVIDLLALMGDKIDNIPGCPGVGDKTATKLIQEYDNVENLLASTETIKGALRKKIEDNAEQIRLSYFLATIRTDVPIDADPDSLVLKEPDREKLFAIFKELEFKSLIDRVGRRLNFSSPSTTPQLHNSTTPNLHNSPSLFDFDDEGNASPSAEADASEEFAPETIIMNSVRDIEALQNDLADKSRCGISFVASGENDMTADIEGIAVAVDENKGYFAPADNKDAIAAVLDLLARTDITKVTSQAKRDFVLAARLRGDNCVPLANYADVSLSHYLLQPELQHTLTVLAQTYLYMTLPKEPLLVTRKNSAPKAGAEEIAAWGSACACVSLRLEDILRNEIEKEGMTNLLDNVEIPLSQVLADMEMQGVRIDVEALDKAAAELEERLGELEKEIFDLAGEVFNVGSPAKVGEILFDRLQLDPKAKKTKTGQYSTSEDILEKVAHKNPIVGKILEWRQLRKLLTTYLTALPAQINPATGKIHTVYNQTVTATGRISSSSPNLQNIPVREELGREIRRAFIPDDGHLFYSADYSQIELRLVADLANDESMIEAFRNGDDIHAITAAKIYHKPVSEVTADERRHAKTANFGILYGISAFGLASRLGIPRTDAKNLIDNYFTSFPTIHNYMAEAVEKARSQGYVSTVMGRKRRLPDIRSKNPVVRGYAERNAINAPIQGTAADIIKVAMVDIFRKFNEAGLKSKMTMQVHDELNFDVVPEELPQVEKIVSESMEGAYSGRVPLTASGGVATNWLDAH